MGQMFEKFTITEVGKFYALYNPGVCLYVNKILFLNPIPSQLNVVNP